MRFVPFAGLILSCALTPALAAQVPSTPPPPLTNRQKHPAPAETVAMPASAAAVGMDVPVITVKGVCQAPEAAQSGCTNTVTREQFEKLTNALKPDMPFDQKRNFASNYGKLLVFYDAARALGLENDPKVQQILGLYQKQIVAQALNEHYSDEYAHPTDQQIEAYYNQNIGRYREANLQRIIIPRVSGSPDKPQPSEAEMKAYAEQLRKKWADGGDAATLQKEAMEKMGLTSGSPDVNFGTKQPGTLPPQHEDIFNLKAGEVSQPIGDPAAFYIYKVVSMRQVPLADVKDSIAKAIHDQELKDKIQQISQSAEPVLNPAYFGEEKASATPSAAPTAPASPTPASSPAVQPH